MEQNVKISKWKDTNETMVDRLVDYSLVKYRQSSAFYQYVDRRAVKIISFLFRNAERQVSAC